MTSIPDHQSRPLRSSRSSYLELGAMRVSIFVPALMSVGFAFWLTALVRDQLRRRRTATLERRSVVAGRATAAITAGRTPDESDLEHSSAARVCLLGSVPFSLLAIYVLIGAIANYFRPGGYVSEIAWLLAISVILSALFAAVAVTLAIVSYQWPRLSPRVRRVVTRSPIGALQDDDREYTQPSVRLTGTLIVLAMSAALVAMVVGSSRGFLGHLDEPLFELAADTSWLGRLSDIDVLGSSMFAVVAAALLGLSSLRCRALVVAYPTALVSAFLFSNLLKVLVERERPPEGPLAGEFDSFPSGHLIMTTILVGLLPLTLAVMLGTTRVIRPLRWLGAAAVVVGAAHRVYDGSHWPTDVLGGVLIGAAIVAAVEWAIAHESWHRRCHDCPWAPELTEPRRAMGAVPIDVDAARILGWASHLSATVVAMLLAALAITRGIPADPEGFLIDAAIQQPVQLGLAGLVSVGTLISWRWPPVGAVLLALSAVGLGVFAALQYEPMIAVAMTVLVTIPAVLLWLSWQHRRGPGEIAALAIVTTVLLLGTWLGASFVYDRIFGPTHPDSVALRVPVDHVEWIWTGALGPESIAVTARLDDDDLPARLVVTSGADTWTTDPVQPTEEGLVRFAIDELEPDQEYRYVVEVDGDADEGRGAGSFRTPPVGPASFRVVAASCARVDSNAAVFDAMAAEDPLMYLALGDVHYSNLADNDVNAFRIAYDRMLTQPGQAALYRDVPVSYVWDDHDYGPNDSDATSPSRDAARAAFREEVPSHELVSDDGAINRAYTIGRVRFVVTDTRSERTGTTMLGAEQLAWLEEELVSASRTHGLVVWMNSTPWIGPASESGDGWAGFADERRRIADVIADADIDNLLMVSGDAHMLAFDDGTNSGYASDGSQGFPVFHAAALDRPGNVKGGPYSGGTFPGFGQYGVIDIADDGRTIEVDLTGKNWKGEILLSEHLRFPG